MQKADGDAAPARAEKNNARTGGNQFRHLSMIQLSELNMKNFDSTIRIQKRDYFALPAHMRCQDRGPMVLVSRGGRETFVPVEILE